MKYLSFFITSLVLLGFAFVASATSTSVIMPVDLLLRHKLGSVKVLIVPGHDMQSWGTDYQGLKEADVNLALAKRLYEYFNEDPKFQVYSARDFATGDYNYGLAQYFKDSTTLVNEFRSERRAAYADSLSSGSISTTTGVAHNFAAEDVAYRLHAINKWANDNGIDVVLHVHFNDYPGRSRTAPGIYNGFAIYVPESQFANAAASQSVARSVFTVLSQIIPPSNLPLESAGVVEDQELIAIGSYNSRLGASFLIEYGYIYEPAIISSPAVRQAYLQELALQTYRGVKGYFLDAADVPVSDLARTKLQADLKQGLRDDTSVLALQRMLQLEGIYPPAGKTLRDCPLSGTFGSCTLSSVTAFQKKYSIPATGLVGPLTRARLNQLYSK